MFKRWVVLAAYVVLASKNAYCPLHGRPSQFSIAADRWTADICRNVSLGVQFTSYILPGPFRLY